MRIIKVSIFLTLFFFVFSFIVSCTPQYKHQKNTVTYLKPAIDKLWSARIRQDWDTVYSLTDSEYQKSTDRQEFIALGEMKEVLEYKILDIKPLDTINHEVRFKFKIKKMGFEFNPVFTELWLFEPDKGWVLNKTKMFSKKPF